MKRYLVIVYQDLEASLVRVKSDAARVKLARLHRFANGDRDGLHRLDVDAAGRPRISDFSGAELVEEARAMLAGGSTTGDVHEGCGGTWAPDTVAPAYVDTCTKCGEGRA